MHRRGVALLDAQLDLPVFLAGDDVDAVQFALLGHDVNRVINEDRCAGGGGDLLRPKLDLLALDHDRVGILRLHFWNLQANHLTRLVRCAVDRCGDFIVVNHHRGVDAGLEQRHLPDRLTGSGVGADHTAVTGGCVKDALAIKPAEVRGGEAAILRASARLGRPDQFAGLFVEAVKAIPRRPLRAPVGHDAAGDHEVVVDHRRRGAAVREGHPAKRLHQRVLPKDFAILRKRGEQTLRALEKKVAGFRVDRRARGGVAGVNDVTQEVVELVLPQFLAGLGVQAEHALL